MFSQVFVQFHAEPFILMESVIFLFVRIILLFLCFLLIFYQKTILKINENIIIE